MTPADLDRWLAENVMGMSICREDECTGCNSDATIDMDGRLCIDADYYRPRYFCPTQNIAQAIEAAEKAIERRLIRDWNVGMPVFSDLPRAEVGLREDSSKGVRDFFAMEKTYPEALCRALYDALSTPTVAGL